MSHSALYRGRLMHRRHVPRIHQFEYNVNLLYLDLSELEQVFAGRWLWSTRRPAPVRWRRRDHLGDPGQTLDQSVRDLVHKETGIRPAGRICLLTNPRYFGYGFNPVSFFYCFDDRGQLATVVAEVNNTPWGERFPYVLPLSAAQSSCGGNSWNWTLDKRMHVSPFHPMEQRYLWRFTAPGEGLRVHMQNRQPDDGTRTFDATLDLSRRPATGPELARALCAHPLMTLEVILGIHWQALRLLLKGVPVHPHPASGGSTTGIDAHGRGKAGL